jgi:glycosyltransferase involved in cell wall biosynthesis
VDILFVHQNFPGQYRHLAPALVAAGHRCQSIGGSGSPGIPAVPHQRYQLTGAAPAGLHPWAQDFHVKCQRAEAVAQQAARLAQQGFRPDLVIGHPGWGELLAIKDVFPNVPVLHQLEFVYQLSGADTGFDPEFRESSDPAAVWNSAARLRLRRAPQLLALHDLDHAMAPTRWQASTAPALFADRITVIHEGIDTQAARPNPMAEIRLQAAGLSFRPGDEVVSFVARNLEPYRGFHVFMRMLPLLQARRPHCHVVIVGADGVSYGSPPPDGRSWRQTLLEELDGQLDLSRIHFVGRVPHSVLHNLFQVSACHVYLTYPFVLSWSLLEAMSCGAVVVASATAPVQEVMSDGENGFLVDFFDGLALAERIATVLHAPKDHQVLAMSARRSIQQKYDLNSICLPRQIQLVRDCVRPRI